ncbi:MAG: CdaR family protein [Kofleriaceae bacterium]|nr:CdaR family protein [Kofleriaceae bacterium]
MRPRSQTIGSLGRSPARQKSAPTPAPPPSSRPPSEPSTRGVIRDWIHGAFFDNLGLKFLSMVLAVTVFLLINDDEDREIRVSVGVSYILPTDKVLTSDRLDEVRVTIRGPERRVRRFDARELSRVSIDLRSARDGEIAFTSDMIQPPAGLTITSIEPRFVRVTFDKRTEKVVEVTPIVAGHPQHGYVTLDIKASPATARVRGAEKTLAALSSVRTREVSVEGRSDPFSESTQLLAPEGIELVGPATVSVEVKLGKELVTRAVPDLRVQVAGEGVDPARWRVEPTQVEVTLTGALLAIEQAKGALRPVVRVSATDKTAKEVEVALEGVPPGIGVRISPERVRLVPAK